MNTRAGMGERKEKESTEKKCGKTEEKEAGCRKLRQEERRDVG